MNTLIQTPTPNLAASLDFYTRLDFEQIGEQMVSDGQVLIEINPDRYARAGIKLYAESWADTREALQAHTQVHAIEGGHLLSDGNGVWIYLIEASRDLNLPEREPAVLGKYAGLSLESTHLAHSRQIWEALGFAHSMGSAEQGWLSLTNEDQVTVSLMQPMSCPHLFFNPSLTYFNSGQNLAIIAEIRARNIPIAEEITHFNPEGKVDNVILRDPGGYGFFVFND